MKPPSVSVAFFRLLAFLVIHFLKTCNKELPRITEIYIVTQFRLEFPRTLYFFYIFKSLTAINWQSLQVRRRRVIDTRGLRAGFQPLALNSCAFWAFSALWALWINSALRARQTKSPNAAFLICLETSRTRRIKKTEKHQKRQKS